MKHYSKILFLAAAFTGLVSCAVNELKEFPVEQPANLAAYEYLKEYDVLKNYVDRTASPDFKLGAGVTAGAFINHGQEYLMSVSNFDEVTPLTEMNHAAIVDNKGKMSFDLVKDFVKDANSAGVSVYGQALARNQQHNNKFLNTLIADRIDPNYVPELVPVEKYIDRTCIEIVSQDMVSAAWDTQFWLYFPDSPMKEGDSWEVSMDVRADKESYAGTQTHVGPGGYIHWAAIGNVTFTTEWATYTASGTVDSSMNTGDAIAFNLNDFQESNKYYFDIISFKLNGVEVIANGSCDDPNGNANFIAKEYPAAAGSPARIVDHYTIELPGGRTPQTPEEMKDTLTTAMDKWIKGAMNATAGQVKAWDAVKDLYAERVDDGSRFYWQDYIGEDDYVKMAFSKARAYYAEADVDGDGTADGNDPAELKLFISEGGLENAQKLASLVAKIADWEKDPNV